MSSDVENLASCLRLVHQVRSQSGKLWRCAADGVAARHVGGSSATGTATEEGQREKRYMTELKVMLDGVTALISELEQSLNSQQPISNPLPLGHSVYLSLDAAVDNIPLYSSLVSSYKWLDKAHDYSAGAAILLSHNNLNRSYGKMVKNRKRATTTIQMGTPQGLDNLIATIGRIYVDMNLQISRPNGTQLNALVEVSLGRVLTAVLIFKGLMIEWVVVKGYNEESTRSDGQVDVWSESKYEVFRRITQNANAAMLNFQSPMYPEMSVRSFLTHLHSFKTLFTEKCRKCGYHLHNNVPPTWREFKSLEPYHEDCRP